MENLSPLQPFAAESINFIEAFSKAVLTDAHIRSFPEIIPLRHCIPPAPLFHTKDQFNTERGDRVFLPRGVALHFAPSNVDSIFVYSWLLSLLIGNLNIVRLSMRRNDQLTQLIATLNCVLARPEFEAVRERSLVLRFHHHDSITEALSGKYQIRVL